MQIGVIPPSLDQVMIGDMKRTRTEEVKILFFLGINEGVIPAANGGGGLSMTIKEKCLKPME